MLKRPSFTDTSHEGVDLAAPMKNLAPLRRCFFCGRAVQMGCARCIGLVGLVGMGRWRQPLDLLGPNSWQMKPSMALWIRSLVLPTLLDRTRPCADFILANGGFPITQRPLTILSRAPHGQVKVLPAPSPICIRSLSCPERCEAVPPWQRTCCRQTCTFTSSWSSGTRPQLWKLL